MAIYSTFFVTDPKALRSGFPDWKPPLDHPVTREITNFFGERRTIQTRTPEWDDIDSANIPIPEYGVVAIKGNYEDYLEQRLPAFVRGVPHWCAKGLTEIELNPVGEVIDNIPAMVNALHSHPSIGAMIQQIRESVVEAISQAPQEVAKKWAAKMSTPEFTHSADGSRRLEDDWSEDDAMSIIQPLLSLVEIATPEQKLYLIVEP